MAAIDAAPNRPAACWVAFSCGGGFLEVLHFATTNEAVELASAIWIWVWGSACCTVVGGSIGHIR